MNEKRIKNKINVQTILIDFLNKNNYETIFEIIYQCTGVQGKLEENTLILEYAGNELETKFIPASINATIDEKINVIEQFFEIVYESIKSLREIHKEKIDSLHSVIDDRIKDIRSLLCEIYDY